MESYQLEKESEGQIERQDREIYLESRFLGSGGWRLQTFKDESKKPILRNKKYNEVTYEKNLNEFVKEILFIINNWKGITVYNKLNEFAKRELLKVIYESIKIEIAFNKDRNSTILKHIINYNFEISSFQEMIQKDLVEIMSSSFGDPELIELLTRTIKIKNNDILNEDVIRSITMCTDYDLVRKGNKSILESLKKEITTNLNKVNLELENKFSKLRTTIIENRESFKRYTISKRIVSGALAGVLLTIPVVSKNIIKSENKTYKTTHTIYSSIEEKKEETEYTKDSIDNSIIINVYGTPYLIDNTLYRDIKTYDMEYIETESELEKYCNFEFNLFPIEPNSITTVEVTEDDILEEYRTIEKINQDKNDTKTLEQEEIDYLTIIFLSIFIALGPIGIGTTVIAFQKAWIKHLNKDLEPNISEIQTLMTECLNTLKRNNLTLIEAIKLTDEIIGTEEYDNLPEEYKAVLDEYTKLKKENKELIETLNEDSVNKYIKKYEKKSI